MNLVPAIGFKQIFGTPPSPLAGAAWPNSGLCSEVRITPDRASGTMKTPPLANRRMIPRLAFIAFGRAAGPVCAKSHRLSRQLSLISNLLKLGPDLLRRDLRRIDGYLRPSRCSTYLLGRSTGLDLCHAANPFRCAPDSFFAACAMNLLRTGYIEFNLMRHISFPPRSFPSAGPPLG